eukprot:TRINITY_DN6064_c0_g1_i1.p1 TRINITY_DN6064_c0_g1~~TRINITY_DN6064_c0_g1_i1.p1  ORF type:complete len:489 (+),score=142.11 TRINITY_DN6064_c0_g1_i1:40-1506(+)
MALAALCVGLCASTLAGVGDDAAPCPTAAAAGTRVRDECFNSTQGLRSCLTAAESDKKACKEAYAECTQGVVQGCFNEDWRQGNATYPAHTVKVRQTAAAFDGDLFEAAVAALLVLPPQYVVVTRADAVVSDRRAAAALGIGKKIKKEKDSTLATFVVKGDGNVQANATTLFVETPDALLYALGDKAWAGIRPANSTTATAGSGANMGVVVALVCAMLLVFLGPGLGILCCTVWQKRKGAQEEAAAEPGEETEAGERLQRASADRSFDSIVDVVEGAVPAASPQPSVSFGMPANCHTPAQHRDLYTSTLAALPPESSSPVQSTPAARVPLGIRELNLADVPSPNTLKRKTPAAGRRGDEGDMEADVTPTVTLTPATDASQTHGATPSSALRHEGTPAASTNDPFSLQRPQLFGRADGTPLQARLEYGTPAHPLRRSNSPFQESPLPLPVGAQSVWSTRGVNPWAASTPPPGGAPSVPTPVHRQATPSL